MRVLIVEDEPAIAEALVFALKTEGFETTHVTTATEAASLLSSNFNLMILDVGLPDKNGFDFLREVRTNNKIPVLMLTARSDEVDRIVGLELGADDYVVKPFSPREVSARARAILRRSQPLADKQNPFEVDEERTTIRYFGEALMLSRYEYNILLLLIKRPGWVFSREKIMDLVWQEPEESFDRAVDTHIKNLRAKLKEIRPDLDPLQTRRGMGYSLKEDI